MATPQPLKPGEDVSKNWRTINDVLYDFRKLQQKVTSLEATVNALNKTRKDGGAASGDVRYEGTWEAKSYTQGALVRKQQGTMQGVYIAREDAEASDEPTYPEAGGPWDLLNFGVIEYEETSNDINGANETIYVNASDRL